VLYRKRFKGDVLDVLVPDQQASGALRRNLSDLFLLEQRHGWYALNAIVREVVARAAERDTTLWRRAHRLAGDWYARHFQATQITSSGHMGGYFVEARYHLVQAGRADELAAITRRFAPHVRSEMQGSPPRDRRALDERIAVLTALVKDGDAAEGLAYHLARCLFQRRHQGDAEQALEHLRSSTELVGSTEPWLLRLRLESECGSIDAVLSAAQQGVTLVPPERGAVSLYHCAGEILARNGRAPDALDFLRKGIAKVPPEHGAFSLYQLAGQLLSKDGHVDEAVTVLRQGISSVGPDYGSVSLYRSAADVLAANRRNAEAIALLREGIATLSSNGGVSTLYQGAGAILSRDNRADEAMAILRDGIARVHPEHNAFSLYQCAAEILAANAGVDEALALLRMGLAEIPPEHGAFSLYQCAAEILTAHARVEEAVTLLREGIAKVPPEHSVFVLYKHAARTLFDVNRTDDAVTILRQGLGVIRPEHNRQRVSEQLILRLASMHRGDLLDEVLAERGLLALGEPTQSLGRCLRAELSGDWPEARDAARASREHTTSYFAGAIHEALCLVALGLPLEASEVLQQLLSPFETVRSGAITWLSAWIALTLGEPVVAHKEWATYVERSQKETRPPEFSDLVDAWRERDSDPAYWFPILPPQIVDTTVPTLEPRSLPIPNRRSNGQLSILAVATEWFSRHGGLSTFNRELCTALARAGHNVVCLLPRADDDERAAAKQVNVQLAEAPDEPDGAPPGIFRPPQVPDAFRPDVIIGHGRWTGPAARAQVQNSFPTAARVHILHTAPGELPNFKMVSDAAARAERDELQELDLSDGATLVAAVGPRLRRETANLLASRNARPPLVRLDPGIEPGERREPPEGLHVLLLGRAEDLPVKGLDIAARAMARLPHPQPRPFTSEPILIVRGAPPGTADSLMEELIGLSRCPRSRIRIREYTPDPELLAADLKRASLLIMPSRTEGFGLVGMEAIAAGTPILVSDHSGLGELLTENLSPAECVHYVVPTRGQPADVSHWARAIEDVLRDTAAAFRRAAALRDTLAAVHTWDAAAARLVDAIRGAIGQGTA
jgi:glycosyltransferase involved in cell wall biosynthesis/tetratricopeptide (TPR) repeat protein